MVCIAVALATALAASAAAQQPPAASDALRARGKILFLRCASCHDVAPGGVARIGPNLHGVVGRKAGSLPDYTYSPALKAAGFVWDPAALDRWLTRPADVVPGTAMAFAGLPKAEDRRAIIAYLQDQGG